MPEAEKGLWEKGVSPCPRLNTQKPGALLTGQNTLKQITGMSVFNQQDRGGIRQFLKSRQSSLVDCQRSDQKKSESGDRFCLCFAPVMVESETLQKLKSNQGERK